MQRDVTYRFYQYANHKHSFVPDLLPEQAMGLQPHQIMYLLERRYGEAATHAAFQYQHTTPSPVHHSPNSDWLKTVNMVGINVRTIGSFWNIVKYALTLPQSQSAIHILPIWECGVVASLYGMASWEINREFFSSELAYSFPHLDSVEKQLKVVINLLHLMEKTVGIDVIPHTDRYSEIALASPHLFEWLQRKDKKIIKHTANLHLEVQEKIIDFIEKYGSATYNLDFVGDFRKVFFTAAFPEHERLRVLFGEPFDLAGRTYRRNQLIQMLYEAGFETVPATMGPPYRGIKVDESESAKVIDKDGRVWRDYVITKPEKFSRVFGPLARYKLYEAKNDNKNWELDFEKPRKEVFQYAAAKYGEVARLFHFDFMRGDMSHVQMRAEGVPNQTDEYYDILKYIKLSIQKEKPYFGYFAESFLAPDGEMAYGSEVAHLEQSLADSTLGDLQSNVVGAEEFMQNFEHYYSVLKQHKVAPSFTIMTADKDDPRFDKFYVKGNELRLFVALFLGDMPSYMGLGFECRDTHLAPAPNEHYTKLYVFQIDEGDKATFGPYHWGQNHELFFRLQQIRLLSEQLLPALQYQTIQWHRPISKTNKLIAWSYENSPYHFIVNLDLENTQEIDLQNIVFSTSGNTKDRKMIEAGECVIKN
jgi:hypothetical protein